MQGGADGYLRQLNHARRINENFRQVITILSLFVVLITFWGLKLTGITMAGEAFCGMDEHVHDETCVEQTLLCTQEEVEAHAHTEACIYRELSCTLEEIAPHAHSEACLEQTLVCTLPEQDAHVHTQDCKEQLLICGLAECAPHAHDSSCNGLVCGLAEAAAHAHSDGCRVLSCGLAEGEEHSHDDSCYTIGCGLAETEGHTHSDSCMGLVCGLEETEGHAHSEACYTRGENNVCGLAEMDAHTHGDGCYVANEGVYICGLEETEGHAHSEACYTYGVGFGCGLTEAEGHVHTAECVTEETQFGCEKEATEGHTHSDVCYEITQICELEEHIHDTSCYSDETADVESAEIWEAAFAELTRSDHTAENVVAVAKTQLGTAESTANFQVDVNGIRRGITRYGQWYGNPYGDWSAMFVSFCLHYAGVEDLPANAGPESMRLEWEQAGLYYPEEEYAPQVGDILFLHKEIQEETVVTVETVINEAGQTAQAEATELEESAAEEAEAEEAKTSSVVTTVKEEAVQITAEDDGRANAVAIITEVTEDTIHVIEGDVGGVVAETSYPISDEAILGYGAVPQAMELMVMAAAPDTARSIARTLPYTESMLTAENRFVLYTASGENYFAFDGSGNAVQVYLDDNGNILSDVADPNVLLWTFTYNNGAYLIKNVSTGRHMHAFSNNGSNVTTTGAYTSNVIDTGDGIKVRSNWDYARLDTSAGKFVVTRDQNQAAVYRFGLYSLCTVWFDGTNGGLMSLMESDDRAFSVQEGDTIQLPTSWKSPGKYSYTLRGWYDVTNSTYHIPGDEVLVTGDMVFYADWMASTYNVGQYNSQVADTISTNKFITTRIFDYNPLFNVQSQTVAVTVDESSHSEIWTSASLGNPVPYKEMDSLEFMFLDYDSTGDISYSRNRSNRNISNSVYTGLYTSQLRSILFDPQRDVIGKTYLGTADHLFQYMDDPNDPNYGYYYYDSKLNAASYNRGAGRFYVYDYLERTADSDKDGGAGKYSDFLPFNSPYANTNGKTVRTYTYAGENGEYGGTTHYMYDAKYNTNNNSTGNVGTNYNFGMSIDIDFYLSHVPGERDVNEDTGNRDIYGNEMCFKFSGDDDVWVLVDGKLVLDIGGVHGIESGEINFSTGVITVNGSQIGTLASYGITDGEHVLTVMYLERGSSQSNCAIYFNLAPRFELTIQKEDVLTQELLNGVEFSVYRDAACTIPAQLWTSEAAHDRGATPTNVFTVRNGIATMWGMSSGTVYYIKETKGPDAPGYSCANGLIKLTIDKDGIATYHVEVIPDAEGNAPSNGFTVHGIRIDDENQKAYIVVTNAPSIVTETTTVQVRKIWKDTKDHSGEYITAYLTVKDADGTVRRIREVILSDENDWHYTWTNLPKYDYDQMSEVVYGVEESYKSGYYSTVRKITEVSTTTTWAEALSFQNGQTVILKTNAGYLSTVSSTSSNLQWVNEATAKNSQLALWNVTVNSNGKVTLTNQVGQKLSFGYESTTYLFYATTDSTGYQSFTPVTETGGLKLYMTSNSGNYYVCALSSNRLSASTSAGDGLIFTPYTKVVQENINPVEDWAYEITNTPLETGNETAVAVEKLWADLGSGDVEADFSQAQVTVKLLANGVDTGRTVTLSLKNGWKAAFRGLPYYDSNGAAISYTVEESWENRNWAPTYGEIEVVETGSVPTYSTTITNTYRGGGGPELPSTGSAGRLLHVLCGFGIMAGSLVYGFSQRRKRERGVSDPS